jgi:hypothetical protein
MGGVGVNETLSFLSERGYKSSKHQSRTECASDWNL